MFKIINVYKMKALVHHPSPSNFLWKRSALTSLYEKEFDIKKQKI